MAERSMTVEAAVKRELKSLAGVDKGAAESALAAAALALARRIDSGESSSSSVASCARALAEVLEPLRLRGMPEVEPAGDRLDELTARRAARKAAAR